MKIAICVKWVPALARMKFDPETRRIVREGVPHELNSFDELAVQWAVQQKTSRDVEVSVFTMGPPPAQDGLIRCIAKGADKAYLITDRAFAGADTLATSQALALALKREKFDIIMFGLFSHDAETGQVGPEVAELMGLPQVTGVTKLDITPNGKSVIAERTLEEGEETVSCTLPCVVAVGEGIAPETSPGRDALMDARDNAEKFITNITAADLTDDMSVFGQAGSPTWVSEIRIIESNREQVMLEGVEPEEAAKQIVAYIKKRGLLKPSARKVTHQGPAAAAKPRPVQGPGVWVAVEYGPNDELKPITKELLGAAQPIADAVNGHVTAVLIGGTHIAAIAPELGHYGADVVYTAAARQLEQYTTENYAATLAAAMQEHSPYAVLLPSTTNGRDLAARVAARLKLGLTGDCIGLEVDGEGRLVQLKPAFGGNIVAPIFSKTKPYMSSIRPGILEELKPNHSRQVPSLPVAVHVSKKPAVRVLESKIEEDTEAAELVNTWAVLGVGMGIGGPENIHELEPLEQLLDAKLICTRDVVEHGWMSRKRQVGITGISVNSALYIGFGIRGDYNHTVGIQRVGTVVAVNSNNRASIFKQADIGVVADWQSILPPLLAELKKELG